MTAIILDSLLEARVIEERRKNGWDRHDEVWDGVYVIFAPKDDSYIFVSGLKGRHQTAQDEILG